MQDEGFHGGGNPAGGLRCRREARGAVDGGVRGARAGHRSGQRDLGCPAAGVCRYARGALRRTRVLGSESRERRVADAGEKGLGSGVPQLQGAPWHEQPATNAGDRRAQNHGRQPLGAGRIDEDGGGCEGDQRRAASIRHPIVEASTYGRGTKAPRVAQCHAGAQGQHSRILPLPSRPSRRRGRSAVAWFWQPLEPQLQRRGL
mmetsp:Transcript_115813/g.327617  ORF Transcript_115813/g.327617 Transcript_115813/m.327617 type:complete len:203 (-) Transcript_115813:1141-1749(-)